MSDNSLIPRALTNRLDRDSVIEACSVLIICAPFLFWHLGRAVYVILALYALMLVLRRKTPGLPREQWLFSLPIAAFLIAEAVSLWYHGWPDRGVNILISRYFLLLLSIPLVSLFVLQLSPGKSVWFRFYLAASAIGILALFDILVRQAKRADAGDSAVIFGFVALALTGVVIGSILEMKTRKHGLRWFSLAFVLGLLAVLLSGSRGAWLALVLMLAVAAPFIFARVSWSKRLVTILAIAAILVLTSWSVPTVQKRFDRFIDMVTPYFDGSQPVKLNSVSMRTETWKVGWQLARENPLLGIGPGHFRKRFIAYVETHPEFEGIIEIRHAHNQYIQTLVTSGLIGLAALLAMLVSHLALFSRYLAMRYPAEVRACALAGVLLVVGYVVMSLTGVPFERKKLILVYGFSVASLWSCILARRIAGLLPEADAEPVATAPQRKKV